jgi:hypothetical protein
MKAPTAGATGHQNEASISLRSFVGGAIEVRPVVE